MVGFVIVERGLTQTPALQPRLSELFVVSLLGCDWQREVRHVQLQAVTLAAIFAVILLELALATDSDLVAFLHVLHDGVGTLAPDLAVDPSGFVLASACGNAEVSDLGVSDFFEFWIFAEVAVCGDVEHQFLALKNLETIVLSAMLITP